MVQKGLKGEETIEVRDAKMDFDSIILDCELCDIRPDVIIQNDWESFHFCCDDSVTITQIEVEDTNKIWVDAPLLLHKMRVLLQFDIHYCLALLQGFIRAAPPFRSRCSSVSLLVRALLLCFISVGLLLLRSSDVMLFSSHSRDMLDAPRVRLLAGTLPQLLDGVLFMDGVLFKGREFFKLDGAAVWLLDRGVLPHAAAVLLLQPLDVLDQAEEYACVVCSCVLPAGSVGRGWCSCLPFSPPRNKAFCCWKNKRNVSPFP
ncbi:hypothetical protein LR48_Vigan11g064000 [Vigna angularis]|uniref:Uncharacterized protein n=1 Tax=Phaseolus angularis TaxID=3914 RepID=A0A0L9VRW6_PHAAN|nr:hypothetical protein LR48_Vigan11g064000 [Vigna angularis]